MWTKINLDWAVPNKKRLGAPHQQELGTETVNREKREANASKLLIGYSLTPSSLFEIHCP